MIYLEETLKTRLLRGTATAIIYEKDKLVQYKSVGQSELSIETRDKFFNLSWIWMMKAGCLACCEPGFNWEKHKHCILHKRYENIAREHLKEKQVRLV